MRNKMIKKAAILSETVLTFLATTTAASACIWGSYQPKEPKSLQ